MLAQHTQSAMPGHSRTGHMQTKGLPTGYWLVDPVKLRDRPPGEENGWHGDAPNRMPAYTEFLLSGF